MISCFGLVLQIFEFLDEPSVKPNFDCVMKDVEGPLHRKKPSWIQEKAVFNTTITQFLNNQIDKLQNILEERLKLDFSDFQAWKR